MTPGHPHHQELTGAVWCRLRPQQSVAGPSRGMPAVLNVQPGGSRAASASGRAWPEVKRSSLRWGSWEEGGGGRAGGVRRAGCRPVLEMPAGLWTLSSHSLQDSPIPRMRTCGSRACRPEYASDSAGSEGSPTTPSRSTVAGRLAGSRPMPSTAVRRRGTWGGQEGQRRELTEGAAAMGRGSGSDANCQWHTCMCAHAVDARTIVTICLCCHCSNCPTQRAICSAHHGGQGQGACIAHHAVQHQHP